MKVRAQLAPRVVQRLVERAAVRVQPLGEHVDRHAVQRERDEHPLAPPPVGERRQQRSEDRRSFGQIALGLCNGRLSREDIRIVWYNIEDLIKLSQRFGETTKLDRELCMLSEQVDIARVEPLGLVEIRLASVPLAAPVFSSTSAVRSKFGFCMHSSRARHALAPMRWAG